MGVFSMILHVMELFVPSTRNTIKVSSLFLLRLRGCRFATPYCDVIFLKNKQFYLLQ